jgi:hypothetical protein
MRHYRHVLGAAGVFALAVALSSAAPFQSTGTSGQSAAGSQSTGSATAGTAGQSDTMKPAATAKDLGSSMADATKLPLRLRAYTMDPNATGTTSATSVGSLDIVIERWSTDAERDRLRDVLVEQGGGDALLKAVQKIKPRAGFVRTTGSVGWDIQFARRTALADGSERIVIGTDRPMSFWERQQSARSAEYEFLLAEVRLKDGKGQGKLVPAALVHWDEGTKTLEIENYQTHPVRLTQVQVVK